VKIKPNKQGVTTHVAVKIKLMRLGKIRTPHYRIVVADARTARNSRAIEEIGRYTPTSEPSFIQVDSARVQYWLGVGALPTEAVEVLLKITGDWQKFKGLPGTEGTLRVAAPKPEKRIAYEAAVKDAMNEPADGATTLKKKAAEKLAAKNAPAPEEVVAAVEEIVTEAVAEAVVEAAVEEAVAEVVAEAEAVVEATPEAVADAAPKEEAAE
jgi:small subunit ribosomal protein S16